MLNDITLIGSKWLISGTKNGFTPFRASFLANNKVDCITVNGNFSATLDYSTSGDHIHIWGLWNTPGGELTWNLMGSYDNQEGGGFYSVKSSAGMQHGKFVMKEQSS